jgi:RNA polymerase sigma factor for flagellar operon FliA
MPDTKRHAIDARIAGLAHSDLWYSYWHNPDSGDALTKLVEAHLPLVRQIVERVSIRLPEHVAVEDLLQSAMLGLYHAINRFDPSQGARFETYATPRIRGAIIDELRSVDHVSRGTRSLIQRIEETLRQWNMDHQSPPTEDELARKLDMSPSELMSTLAQGQPTLSLDSIVMEREGQSVTLMDIVADDRSANPRDEVERKEMNAVLRKAFLKLTAREQKILYLYYFEELRLREIAELFGVTDARICQIHALIVVKLRTLLGVKDKTNVAPQPCGKHDSSSSGAKL